MIAKDTTTIVNFYVADTDGLPATGQASNISASISINGDTASSISDTITEIDSTNLPGWYKFTHTFSTAGNVFITFTATNCIIMPWEDEVVEVAGASASEVARAVWSDTANYPIFQGQYPKGYYQSNPPVVNVWGQTAYPQQSTTYGDLVKGIPTINSNVSAVKAKTDNLPASPAATGDAMTLTSAYDAAKTASQLTSADLPSDYAKPGDAMTLTSAYDAAKTASQLTSADLPSDYAKPGDAMTLTSAYDAAKTASQLTSADLPSDYAKPGDAMTLTSAYDAAKTASQLTSADIPTVSNIQSGLAKTSDLSGLSTFDPSMDTVTIEATQAATMTTATGFATSSDISGAQSAIISAMPTIPNDYAKTTDVAAVNALIKRLDAGVLHWSTTATVLTLYNDDNTTLKTYTLQRDAQGNITRIDPNA